MMGKFAEYRAKFEYTLFSGSNGFTIARYKALDNSPDRAKGSVIIAKGSDLPRSKMQEVVLIGTWRADKNREGEYLEVQNFEILLPTSRQGVIDYLSTLGVRIGRKLAGNIFDRFGESVWDVLDHEPDRLMEVRGVSQGRVTALKKVLDETRLKRKILMEFSACEEMTPRRADKVISMYGSEALEKIHQNPYLLCNIRGFGFNTVDAIARTMPGFEMEGKNRLDAGIQAVFQANATKGHTCVPKPVALNDLQRILQVQNVAVCRDALNNAYLGKRCKVKGHYCYGKGQFATEKSVAENVLRIAREIPKRKGVDGNKMDEYLDEFQAENGIILAEQQRNAVKSCFTNNLSIITGGPGTGKSTIIKAILHVAERSNPKRAAAMLMAPTGKAARRMEEATGHPASTIHQALGIRYNDENVSVHSRGVMADDEPLEADFVVVDEVSMIDQNLADCLFSRIGDTTSVVLVGDGDQLPSVGAGNVLAELIRSERVPVHRLNVIFRQKDGNPIITNSAKIRDGQTDLEFTRTFKNFDLREPQAIFDKACSFYCKCVEHYGVDNVAMLVPHRIKGQICSNRLNAELERRLNPAREGDITIRVNGKEFRAGDKVMQTRNTDMAKNGDIGYIRSIEEVTDEETRKKRLVCNIDFDGYPGLEYNADDMENVDWAYAQSIHKSQGTEYQTVIVVMSGEHELMARRNLLYTAVTRAKQNVALIGEMSVFRKAIGNCEAEVRHTQLADFIRVLDNTVPQGVDPRYYTPLK